MCAQINGSHLNLYLSPLSSFLENTFCKLRHKDYTLDWSSGSSVCMMEVYESSTSPWCWWRERQKSPACWSWSQWRCREPDPPSQEPETNSPRNLQHTHKHTHLTLSHSKCWVVTGVLISCFEWLLGGYLLTLVKEHKPNECLWYSAL